MISQSGAYRRGERERLLWALLASGLLNALAWIIVPAALNRNPAHETAEERPVVVTSLARIERTRPRHRSAPPAAADATAMLAPPPPANLALPAGWARQDMAFLGTTSSAEWLDWSKSKQSSKWVPRIFVWQMRAKPAYMRPPSLQDAVQQILATLHDDARIAASRAQRVCSGQREGWFLSYVKPADDPPLHFDETLYLDGTKIYRAMYIRAADQPEDPTSRDALNTLCAT